MPADSAPRLFARKERNLTTYIFRTKMFHVEQKSREERGMFHVEHKKERAAGGVNVPRGTSPKKSRRENQPKCKAKKKNPAENGQKKYRPRRRYFYPMRVVARTTPKMKRIKIAVFRAATRAAWRDGSRIHSDRKNYSGRKDYSSTTVVQPYLSSQRPYWISCNLL